MIRAGVTGVAGQVAEPYIDSAVRPDILFPAYLAGFNLAEAFYLAMPSLSWQTIVVGDPLCAAVQGVPIAPADLDPPIDPETELPSKYAARRLATFDSKMKPEVAKLFLRSESRMARDDTSGAREALERLVAVDDHSTLAWHLLGTMYERSKEYPKARAAYQKLIDQDPKDAIALNNLAYLLAVNEGKPAEALPLAERANLIAPRNPASWTRSGRSSTCWATIRLPSSSSPTRRWW